jgi:Skp family chaperone for outer membrane proteins
MKKLNSDLLGWMAAATLAGIIASTGFQGATESWAVCDLQKVVKGSDLYKTEEKSFQAKVDARRGLLQFISENRVIAADEWKILRDLSLKESPTEGDKSDLAKLKDTIVAHSKKLVELQGKSTKTNDDLLILEDYQQRLQKTQVSANALNEEFSRDLPVIQDQAAKVVEDQARTAVQAVGKEQGYTLVFDMLAAPYGNHDITDAALARMNKK